ncbi:MAG: HNH endonuclease [Armatimonadetes bacterium]|nr:HNH endonuclease [Armatimonadota bacterium]
MIRADVKRLVRTTYAFSCGYCGVSETEVGAELTYDHFVPQSKGGTDDAENLVYACHACNEFKGDYYETDDAARLLHPLRDDLTAHWNEAATGELEAITASGTVYIARLHLNRPPLVRRRRNNALIAAALRLQEQRKATVAGAIAALDRRKRRGKRQ